MVCMERLTLELESAKVEKSQSVFSDACVDNVKYWTTKSESCLKSYEKISRQVLRTMLEGEKLEILDRVENELHNLALF